MLKLKYLFENYDLARTCLACYDYHEESLDEMLPYFRISSNAIYPFRMKEEPEEICFLRLSPVEEKSISHVFSEVTLINWLREKGFPTMRPVAMKNGEFAREMTTEWGTFNVSCFALVSGENLEDVDGTLDIVKGYGKILGEFHALMREYPYTKEHRNHKDLLEEIGGRLKCYGAPELVLNEYLAVCNELEQLSIATDNYGVIHYDFEPDNVFYDVEKDLFSVIDFDDVICCWYTLDIVRAIDALDEVIGESEIDRAQDFFLEGYQSAVDLTQEQRQSFSLMRRLVHLQEYATLLHVLSEPVDEKPDWMSELICKLQYKLRCLEEHM